MRFSRLLVITLVAAGWIGAAQGQVTSPSKQQLSPGKLPGTYAFSYTNAIQFTQEPAFPVTVVISNDPVINDLKKALATATVTDSNPFTISDDLPPGGYWLSAQPAPDKDALYWGSGIINFFITPQGVATIHDSLNHPLTLAKKMTVLSPDWKGADVTEKRPVLKWQPLPGADSYRIDWLVERPGQPYGPSGNGSTRDTQYQMPEDVQTGCRYEWSVWAERPGAPDTPFFREQPALGYWDAAYFYTPGGKEAFLKHEPDRITGQKGAAYFGVNLGPWMPDGIVLNNVIAGSPALAAGLQPNDILTSFNGKSLDGVTTKDFVAMVRAQAIGSVVKLEYFRDGVKKTTQVTVAAMP